MDKTTTLHMIKNLSHDFAGVLLNGQQFPILKTIKSFYRLYKMN